MQKKYFLYFIITFLPFLLPTVPYAFDLEFTSSNLPIIVINTLGNVIPDEPKITATMGIINNGPDQRNNNDDPYNEYNGFIGIEIHGQSSQNFPKKSYGIETRLENGENNNVSLFGMPTENDWILYGPYSDKALIRNKIAYDTYRNLGHYSVRSQFCEVVLNNVYIGLYLILEKPKRDNKRVDIAKPDENNLSGGYILEMTSDAKLDEGEIYFRGTKSGKPFVVKYPKPDNLTGLEKNWITNYINNFEQNLYSPHFSDPDSGYSQYIKTESFIDYILINEAFRNNDAFFSSTFIVKEKDQKLTMGPIWDFNITMGNINYNDNWKINGWWMPETNWPGKLLADSVFYNRYINRWDTLRKTTLNTKNILNKIDSLATLLDEAQERNFEKYSILDEYVWPNYWITGSYYSEVDSLKDWIKKRFNWIDGEWGITSIREDVSRFHPQKISLKNYPNPFNSETVFEYYLESSSTVSLDLFSVEGRHIKQFFKKKINRGTHFFRLNFSDFGMPFSSGVYISRLTTAKAQASTKLILIK